MLSKLINSTQMQQDFHRFLYTTSTGIWQKKIKIVASQKILNHKLYFCRTNH